MKKNNLIIILIALAVADFLGAIDSTALNVALPRITSTLHISIITAQWLPNAFTLALVAFLIFMGKLGSRVGTKKLYLIGLSVFGLSSLLLGFTNSVSALIIIRVIQGIATAILYTMPMIIIANLWKEREKAFAVTSATFAGGMLVGPVLGGMLANLEFDSFHGWHLVFLINVPLVIVGLIIAKKYIPEIPKVEQKIDFGSMLILLSALAIIVLSFAQISRYYLILGILLLLLLYFYQRKIKNSLVDFHLFQNQTFTAANLVSFFGMTAMIGMLFVLTFYLQDILHWNPLQAGLALLPVPVIAGIFSVLGGQIKSWRLGGFLSAIFILSGLVILCFIDPSVSYFAGIFPGLAMVAAGSGILMTSIFAAILGSTSIKDAGSASGILNTLQQMGSLIGIAIIASITLKYQLAFTVLTGCGIMGLISAFFIKNKTNYYKN